jgi:hypothetical protein
LPDGDWSIRAVVEGFHGRTLLQKLGGDEDCDITELGAQVSMAQ